jgi:hypothetical protein
MVVQSTSIVRAPPENPKSTRPTGNNEKFLISELSHFLDNAPSCYSNAYYGQVNESAICSFAIGWVLLLQRRSKAEIDYNIDQLLVHVAIIAQFTK